MEKSMLELYKDALISKPDPKLNAKEQKEILKKRVLNSLKINIDEHNAKETIRATRDKLIEHVNSGILSRNDLKQYITENNQTEEAGLVSTVLYLTSKNFREMAEATDIGTRQYRGFMACKGEINNLGDFQGWFSELDYAEEFYGLAGKDSDYKFAKEFLGNAGENSKYNHAQDFRYRAGENSKYTHATNICKRARQTSKMPLKIRLKNIASTD